MTPEQLREHVHGIIPDRWLGITGPLTDEQEKDLETYYRVMTDRYRRHTVDVDRQPMSFEDESPGRWRLYVLLVLTGAALGVCFGWRVLPHWVGP